MPEFRDGLQFPIEDVAQVHRMVSSVYVVVDAFDGGRADHLVANEGLMGFQLVVRKKPLWPELAWTRAVLHRCVCVRFR